MANLQLGIAVFVFSALIYFLAYRKFLSGKFAAALFFILLAGLALRVYCSLDFFLHEWDERYHALVAKNLMNNFLEPTLYANCPLPCNPTSWTESHTWLHKFPIPLWLMAISLKTFGVNEIAVRLPSIILSTLSIAITYKIAKVLFNEKVALLAAFLHSINGLVIETASGRVATDHIDALFLVFVELSVYFSLTGIKSRKILNYIFCGIFLCAAILTKWLPALIVIPIWLSIRLKNEFKITTILLEILLIIFPSVIAAGAWQYYTFTHFPVEYAYEAAHRTKHIFEVLDQQGGNIFYHFTKAMRVVHELCWIAFAFGIFFWLKHRQWQYLPLIVWIAVPYLFFTFVETKMQAYLLFCAPPFFILLATMYWEIKTWFIKPKYMMLVFIGVFFFLPIRYSVERTKVFWQRDLKPEWVTRVKNYNKLPQKTVVFNEPHNIEAMFYADVTAVYNFMPDEATKAKLQAEGYQVYVNN